MTFDPENHLIASGSTWSAGYNGDGLQALRTVSGTTTYTLYDGSDPVVELDGSGSVLSTNSFGTIGLISRDSTSYTFDWRGGVSQRLDASQAVLTSLAHDAFGNTSSSGSTSDPFADFGGQFGYYVDGSGFQRLGFRHYDSAAGRFLTQDPIGFHGGINAYSYTSNNPTNRVDHLGHAWVEVWYHSVGGTFGYHAFIVVTENTVKIGPPAQYYFRGGIDHMRGRNEIGFQWGIYGPGTPDWLPIGDGNRANYHLVIKDDKPASYYIKIFVKRGMEIRDAHIGYATGVTNLFPGCGNSDSLARELLEAAGFTTSFRHPVWVPYWDSKLYQAWGKKK